MTWKQLVGKAANGMLLPPFWKRRTVPQKELERALKVAFTAIAEEALHGRKVVIPGFGVFSLRTRVARRVRNPVTKEMMQIPADRRIGFRCSKLIVR